MIPVRARSEAAKAERREAILEASARLFSRFNFNNISMEDIARETGMAKGTLYLYFETKEEVFMALMGRAMTMWFIDLGMRLGVSKRRLARAGFAQGLVESLKDHPDLPRLLSLMHVVLEHNVSTEAAREFKRTLKFQFGVVSQQLETRLALKPGEGWSLMVRLYALVLGLWQMANPAPVVAEVLEEAELRDFRIDFTSELRACVLQLLK